MDLDWKSFKEEKPKLKKGELLAVVRESWQFFCFACATDHFCNLSEKQGRMFVFCNYCGNKNEIFPSDNWSVVSNISK